MRTTYSLETITNAPGTPAPQLGDMIAVPKDIGLHVGIFVGNRGGLTCGVIHNDRNTGAVILSSMEDFRKGKQIRIHKPVQGGWFERERIVQAAFSLIGRKYDLLRFNCEHAANLSQTGVAESPQLQGFAIVAILGFLHSRALSE
jgi:hypothetical protein